MNLVSVRSWESLTLRPTLAASRTSNMPANDHDIHIHPRSDRLTADDGFNMSDSGVLWYSDLLQKKHFQGQDSIILVEPNEPSSPVMSGGTVCSLTPARRPSVNTGTTGGVLCSPYHSSVGTARQTRLLTLKQLRTV